MLYIAAWLLYTYPTSSLPLSLLTYLLTPWSRVLLEKLTGSAAVVKKFPAFLEPESSSPYSQVPATCPYPEPTPSSPHSPSQFPKIHLNIILPSTSGSPWIGFTMPYFHSCGMISSSVNKSCLYRFPLVLATGLCWVLWPFRFPNRDRNLFTW